MRTFKQYGVMPPRPAYEAVIKGDDTVYRVCGFDWVNGRVMLERPVGWYEWVGVDRVCLHRLSPIREPIDKPVDMGEYTVWGGLTMGRGSQQVRTILAAKTEKQAMGLLRITTPHFMANWSKTLNPVEQEIALASPGVVLQASSLSGFDFIPRE